MGLACLFSMPNSFPFLSAQNAFVILLSVLIQMGEKEQERKEKTTRKSKRGEGEEEAFGGNLVRESAESGKPAVGKYSRKQEKFYCCHWPTASD